MEKEFTISMKPEEAEKVLLEHIKKEHGYNADSVEFKIIGDSDYCGQIVGSIVFKGKLK